MKNQFQILLELKRVDEKAGRLQQQMERIPGELAKLESSLNERRGKYTTAKTQFETNEKALRKAEADVREKDDLIKKAEAKIMEVKTNEEYQAGMKENEGGKADKGKLEELVLTLMNTVEEYRKKLKEAETEFKGFEATITADRNQLEDERTKLSRAYEEQITKKNTIASQLDPAVSSVYKKVAARPRGITIVIAENGMCLGCNMKIRPQLYNEVLGCKVVHRCPSCGGILVASSLDSDTTAAQE